MDRSQIDKDLRFIRTRVPGFVRTIFELYSKSQIDLSNCIEEFNKKPYSCNKRAQGINTLPFIDLYKDINPDEAVNLQKDLIKVTVYEPYFHYDEEINKLGDGDIYAPVVRISSVITAFDYVHNTVPLLYFAPNCAEVTYLNTSKELGLYNITHDDTLGAPSIFNRFNTNLVIDVNHLMTFFFRDVWNRLPNMMTVNGVDTSHMDLETYTIAKTIAIRDFLLSKDSAEIINKMVDTVSEKLVASAVITYLSYFGKLIGARTNLLDWVYSTFMKDIINKLDNDEITTSNNYVEPNIKESTHNDLVSRLDEQDQMFKGYNQLQLTFTNWSFIIDTIIRSDPGNRRQTKCKYAKMAYECLSNLLVNRYTTYNILLYLGKKGPAKTQELVDIAIKRVIEFDNLSYLKDIKNSGYDIDYFMRNNLNGEYKLDNVQLAKQNYTNRVIGDIFLKFCYLTLFEFSYLNAPATIDETEYYTGKSKRAFIVSKFTDILTSISSIISKYGKDNYYMNDSSIITKSEYRECLNKDAKKFSSTINVNLDSCNCEAVDSEYNKLDYNYTTTSMNDKISKNDIVYIMNALYDIRPSTVLRQLSNTMSDWNINDDINKYSSADEGETDYFNLSNVKFMDVVTDKIAPSTNRMFTLESLEQSLEEFEGGTDGSEESEWAAGGYNALAGFSSGVIEVTNEADNANAASFIPPTVDDMAESQSTDSIEKGKKAFESYRERVKNINDRLTRILLKKFD